MPPARPATPLLPGASLSFPTQGERTLAHLIDRYIRDVLPTKPKAIRVQGQQLRWWRDILGHLPLAELTPARLAEARDILAAGITPQGRRRSPASVVRYMAALSHALTLAWREWEWMGENPLARVRKPREPRGRVRFLSESERPRLLEACKTRNPALYPVVVIALYTGMRKDEILSLRWSNVDLVRRRVQLEDTKNGERRQVPLVGPAAEVMLEWWERRTGHPRDGFLFPAINKAGQPIDLRKAWATAIKNSQIDYFHIHDIRHSTASYMAMSGATSAEIAEVLGHKTLQMVKRYSHLSESHSRGVMERMAEKFKAG